MFPRCVHLLEKKVYLCCTRQLWTSMKEDGLLTIHETREKLKALVGANIQKGSAAAGDMGITSQDELSVRTMSDSYREAIIPLGSNPMVKEKYMNIYKGIRFGRILEDLDTFAVAIGYTHTCYPNMLEKQSPVAIVTALVDRIEMTEKGIMADKDIRMTGKVTWAGKSSMEMTMDLDQEIDDNWSRLLTAKFLMVARNPATKKSAVINKLVPESPEEESLFKQGEANKFKRMSEMQQTLLKTPPSEEERLLIHNLFLNTIDPTAHTFTVRVKPENSEWMESTKLKTVIVCMPEQRNLYNKIFGGYLMRKAFELAWANAALYCKARPYIEVVDDIAFRKTVEVGSLLFLSSEVVYTKDTRLQVKVHAEVINPFDDTRETTNDFHFTFNARGSTPVKTVIPKSYAESMLYLDGKRHFNQ